MLRSKIHKQNLLLNQTYTEKLESLKIDSFHGAINIHFGELRLTALGLEYIQSKAKDYVELNWKLLDHEGSAKAPAYAIDFNTIFVCKVMIDENVVSAIASEKLRVSISLPETREVNFAIGIMELKDILSDIDQKVHKHLDFKFSSKLKSTRDMSERLFGSVSIWYHVICEGKQIVELAAQVRSRDQERVMDEMPEYGVAEMRRLLRFSADVSDPELVPTESEYISFKEALHLVLIRNRTLHTTQSMIDREMRDRVDWLHEECDWRLTLQESAILRGSNPRGIDWRQWREENTFKTKVRHFDFEPKYYEPVVYITINSVTISDLKCLPLAITHHIYVEYSFLAHHGPELETPRSLLVSKHNEYSTHYEHQCAFSIDPKKSLKDAVLLTNMVRNNQPVEFTVICEPTMVETMNRVTCVVLGKAKMSLLRLVDECNDIISISLKIRNFNDPCETLGRLRVTVRGVQVMREVCLTIMENLMAQSMNEEDSNSEIVSNRLQNNADGTH